VETLAITSRHSEYHQKYGWQNKVRKNYPQRHGGTSYRFSDEICYRKRSAPNDDSAKGFNQTRKYNPPGLFVVKKADKNLVPNIPGKRQTSPSPGMLYSFTGFLGR
jgi:hypothetical protein